MEPTRVLHASIVRILAALIASVAITSCGGGGSDSDTVANHALSGSSGGSAIGTGSDRRRERWPGVHGRPGARLDLDHCRAVAGDLVTGDRSVARPRCRFQSSRRSRPPVVGRAALELQRSGSHLHDDLRPGRRASHRAPGHRDRPRHVLPRDHEPARWPPAGQRRHRQRQRQHLRPGKQQLDVGRADEHPARVPQQRPDRRWRVLALGGSWSGGVGNKNGEIWTPSTGWRLLPGVPVDPMVGPDPGGMLPSRQSPLAVRHRRSDGCSMPVRRST